MNGQMLAKKNLRIGYYWPTLNEDYSIFVRTYIKCQLYADKIHVPASALHSLQSPWPFLMWAFDVVGPLEDLYGETRRVSFILTATDYFTKWAEVEAYPIIKANTLVNFIVRNVISRFGIPEQLITDNNSQFISQGL